MGAGVYERSSLGEFEGKSADNCAGIFLLTVPIRYIANIL